MKQKIAALFLTVCSITATAQNPTLMTINGKDVTRAEFEYAYNKNNNVEGAVEQKTVDEYVEMFINYKLKVAEAESQRIDTLKSFIDEFHTYRDMQLTPHLVDQQYIDSVAHSLYNRQVEYLGGKDLLDCSHILLIVKQTDSEVRRQQVAQRADSIYSALMAGAAFDDLAKRFSEDQGSAEKGGRLPTIYPGMTIPEFEKEAYALQPGTFSQPFITTVGYHIVLMHDRKQLDSFETLYPTIVANLKRRGIEEESSKAKIERLMVETGQTREEILLAALEEQKVNNPNLEYLVQEYHDGLLFYEVAKKRIWDAAEQDTDALKRTFANSRSKYAWKEPRFSGFIISGKTMADAKKAKKLLKNGVPAGHDLRSFIKETINKDSVVVMVSSPVLAKKGENSTIDRLAFGDKSSEIKSLRKGFPFTIIAGKKQKQPLSYHDVKADVIADLQKALEEEWVAELRKKYSFTIDKNVLKTVNNH